jgi:hypothetical protein
MDKPSMIGEINAAAALWDSVKKKLDEACETARLTPGNASRPLGDLVRKWREADHPGENLLVALAAAEKHKDASEALVIGIGWGGIELPLVYDYVMRRKGSKQNRTIFIARWSHYRKVKEIGWDVFPEGDLDRPRPKDTVILFDDNTLTGITLEHIRDTLMILGAKSVSLYVTRFSGERRLAQMRMPDHGAVDPSVLLSEVGGYIGETPFARSWSQKEYRNPIGVFSLSKRRILECIHINSTVELYQREGF